MVLPEEGRQQDPSVREIIAAMYELEVKVRRSSDSWRESRMRFVYLLLDCLESKYDQSEIAGSTFLDRDR